MYALKFNKGDFVEELRWYYNEKKSTKTFERPNIMNEYTKF